MTFERLGLRPELLRAVAAAGYTDPTPVQDAAIPIVLAGRDLLAGAQTGTGKTAAFVLPLLQRLHETGPNATPSSAATPNGTAPYVMAPSPTGPRATATGPRRHDVARSPHRLRTPEHGTMRRHVRALVLAPTRELALQVEESVRTYGAGRPVRSLAIYGGVGFEPQARALRAGVDIVVATPGRLLDHVGQRTIDLSRVEILVLDEADRMLDMGFIRDIRRILAILPPGRQNLLFSATFSSDIRTLAAGLLERPETIDLSPRHTAAELVEQVVLPVDRERKRALLTHLVRSGRIEQALVFTRTKHGANRLAELLARDGIAAAAIHGNKSQGQRVRALADFKARRVDVLVATDIAARGIDIDSLPHVVNFELPTVPQDYVHRIGRTGRAGIGGDAVSLVCVDEVPLLRDIESLLRRSIRSEIVPGFEPDRSIRPEPIQLRSGPPRHRSTQPARRYPPSGRPMRRPSTRPSGAVPAGARPSPHHAGPRTSGPSAHPPVAMPGERLARVTGPAHTQHRSGPPPARAGAAPSSATMRSR